MLRGRAEAGACGGSGFAGGRRVQLAPVEGDEPQSRRHLAEHAQAGVLALGAAAAGSSQPDEDGQDQQGEG